MNYFITGGSGDIGNEIIKFLKKDNHTIIYPPSNELNLNGPLKLNKYNNIEYDGIIHCAAINNPKKINEISNTEFIEALQINTLSLLEIINKLNIKTGSNIIVISSIYSFLTREGRLIYTTSKHALNGMIKTLALELAEQNIKINAISPGFIDNKLTRKNNTLKRIEDIKNNIPLKRMGTSNEIVEIVKFLLFNNTYITGQNIIVDGGYSLKGA